MKRPGFDAPSGCVYWRVDRVSRSVVIGLGLDGGHRPGVHEPIGAVPVHLAGVTCSRLAKVAMGRPLDAAHAGPDRP